MNQHKSDRKTQAWEEVATKADLVILAAVILVAVCVGLLVSR